MTTSANEPSQGTTPAAPPAVRRTGRPEGRVGPDRELAIPTAIEPSGRPVLPNAAHPIAPARPLPAPATPRWIEPERDYRSPTPIERARLLRAAYDASGTDPEQRLLLAELMAHYRAWCLRHGKGDPFAGLSRE